jgi:hypothetical protein
MQTALDLAQSTGDFKISRCMIGNDNDENVVLVLCLYLILHLLLMLNIL